MARDIYFEVTNIMLGLALQPRLPGFELLREAVVLNCQYGNNEEKFTTEIYPKVAEKFNTTTHLVEKNIRLVIADAYESGGLLSINEFYDEVVYRKDYTFSNSELVSIITEILNLKKIREALSKKEN